MIYVDRDQIPIPKLFNKKISGYDAEVIERLHESNKYSQSRFRGDSDIVKKFRPEIEKLFNGKCCYCESRLDDMDVEHFRPISSINEKSNIPNEGYYWLTYKWFNLYLSCAVCNRYKSNNFPVKGKRLAPPDVETYQNYDTLKAYVASEEAMLVDPCDINDHKRLNFRYDDEGFIIPMNTKAEYTIQFLNLNRTELVKNRAELINHINSIISVETTTYDASVINAVLSFLSDEQPFLGVTRQRIARWFLRNEVYIQERFPNEHKKLRAAYRKSPIPTPLLAGNIKMAGSKPRPVLSENEYEESEIKSEIEEDTKYAKYLEWIDIKDYKCIDHTRLKIPEASTTDGENSILLIGENGVGKSTILQAIALSMMGQEQLDKLNIGNPSKFIRRNSRATKATIKVKFRDDEDIVEVVISKKGFKSNRPTLVKPTIGIGSVRRLPESGESTSYDDDTSRILGLFRHDVVLPEIEPWLSDTKKVNASQFNEAAKTIIDMLMIPEEVISKDRMLNRKSGKLSINLGEGPESVEEMCDGHRSVIAYALYIMRCLTEHWSSAFNAEGLVIIDEIGNHLHPTWKIKVVALLRSVFPKTIFIISTHDPLCLRSAREGEVWVMNKMPETNKLSVLQKDVPLGMSIESLLTGNWFYMEHTTDDRTSKLIEDHSTEMFSEVPDQKRIKDIEKQLEGTLMQTPFGNTNLDTYLHFVKEIQTESTSNIAEDETLRNSLADRIRNQIKSKDA